MPRRLLQKKKGFGAKRPDYRRKRIVTKVPTGDSQGHHDNSHDKTVVVLKRTNYYRKYRFQRKFLREMEASTLTVKNNKEYSFARRLYYQVLPYFYLILTDVNDNLRLKDVEAVIRQSIDCYRNRIISPFSHSPCATVHGRCVRAHDYCRNRVGPCVPCSATAELRISDIVSRLC